ncbi:hypothetical protein DI487_08530 [Flavobacterium sediminis]|uniref:Peptidase S1 domain-containing protein n=1 Tax=Flavobacterium sediminis TaxID=2201181 RepID=A0A2U8QUU6_9FLAO|nr:trypsin-like serine protease [Flavobacterium sediminis]AWM13903.1 hypothetical protein DI487_08530 [Flavobacterium sediminis]
MALELIKKSCVKVSIIIDGETVKQGSGVIIHFSSKFYVLTAYHCVDDNEIENIIIERQEHYNSNFEKIEIISKVEFDIDNDWMLLEVDYQDDDLKNIKTAKNFIADEVVSFSGYQNILERDRRKWDAKILDLATSSFKITLEGKSFQQAGEDAVSIAEGLSGSGVYVIKDGKPYLIGILCSIKDEKGFNDDIDCCLITNLIKYISECQDLSDMDYLDKWSENLENRSVEEEIEEWKNSNVKQFEDIIRKNKVLYGDNQIADRKTSIDIKKYQSIKNNIDEYEDKYPELFKKFREIIKRYKDTVEYDFTGEVENSSVAKEVRRSLNESLKRELEKIFNADMKLDITEYQIIEWLMDCTLNFIPKKND